MHIRTAMRYHHIHIRMSKSLKLKRMTIPQVDKDAKQLGFPVHEGNMKTMVRPFWKKCGLLQS